MQECAPARSAGEGPRCRGRRRRRPHRCDNGQHRLPGGFGRPPAVPRAGHREREAVVRERQDGERHAQPEQPVIQDGAGQGRHQRVALDRGPVLGDQAERCTAERVQQCGDALLVEVAHEAAGQAVADEEAHQPHVRVHQAARERGQAEEQRAHEQHVRHDHHQHAPDVGLPQERAHALRLEPRHQTADHDRGNHRGGHEQRRAVGARESPEHVGDAGDTRGVQDLLRAELLVAQYRAGHEGCGHEYAGHTGERHEQQDHVGRVAVDVANGPAHLHEIAGYGTEDDEEEEQRAQPEQCGARVVAQLEAEDVAEHDGLTPPGAGRRRPGWRSTHPRDPA